MPRQQSDEGLSNVSVVGDKELLLRDGTVVTTDRARTGLATASYVQLDATGPIDVTGDVELDAGTLASFRTQRLEDNVCVWTTSRSTPTAASAGSSSATSVGTSSPTAPRVSLDGSSAWIASSKESARPRTTRSSTPGHFS